MLASIIGGLFVAVSTTWGAVVVDQSQEVISSAYPIQDSTMPFWQSFQAGMNGRLVQIDVYNNNEYFNIEFTLNIYEGTGTGGALLSTSDLTLPDHSTWASLTLAQTAAITSGQTYTFAIVSVGAGDVASLVAGSGNPYPNGQLNVPGYSTTDKDLAFRTYVDDYVIIPEPAALTLVYLGGLILIIRRVRNGTDESHRS